MSQSSTPAASDAIYDASSLGRPRMFLLGLQHLFAMFGATVLVPVLTGLSVSATLLFAGLGTLLFHFLSRGKVPAFLGSSFAFIAGYAAIAPNGETELLPYACLGVACAGLLYPVLAALFRAFGAKRVMRFFPPVVTGPIVISIGLILASSAIANCQTNWLVAVIGVAVIVICNIWGRGMVKIVPILLGVVVSYAVAAVLGGLLAILLFTVLPTFLVGGVNRLLPLGRWGKVVLEAVLKVAIFLTYMVGISKMKEIHRVFEYHGAEHKTIACYEAGDPLTVENVRKYTRFHPRCGTSFLILVVIVSVFLYSVLPWSSTSLRVVFKLLLLPLVMGISYELLKWCGRSDNIATRIIRQPGIWVQHLTVFEPDDSMIEVAIAAITPVLPENPEEGKW